MNHVPAKLQSVLEGAMPPGIDLMCKPMFGGIGAYADGRMFCSLSNVGLALKFGSEGHAALLKVKGAKPLQYEPSMPPSKSYVVVPDTMLKDRERLSSWLAKSVAFVKTVPPKKPKKRSLKRAAKGRN